MNGIQVMDITRRVSGPSQADLTVFEHFSLELFPEITGILGPNGCGKTTLLNMIAGITRPDSGQIVIGSGKRNIGYVFQDYRNSLFPWLSIRDNILFPLKIQGCKKAEELERLASLRRITGELPFDLDRYPYQLSGGQQQYVAILRSLIADPAVLLLDEPFSALDYQNAVWLKTRVAGILNAINIPVVLIVHDIDHLISLADRILVLSQKPTHILKEFTVKASRPRDKMPDDGQCLRNELFQLIGSNWYGENLAG